MGQGVVVKGERKEDTQVVVILDEQVFSCNCFGLGMACGHGSVKCAEKRVVLNRWRDDSSASNSQAWCTACCGVLKVWPLLLSLVLSDVDSKNRSLRKSSLKVIFLMFWLGFTSSSSVRRGTSSRSYSRIDVRNKQTLIRMFHNVLSVGSKGSWGTNPSHNVLRSRVI